MWMSRQEVGSWWVGPKRRHGEKQDVTHNCSGRENAIHHAKTRYNPIDKQRTKQRHTYGDPSHHRFNGNATTANGMETTDLHAIRYVERLFFRD